jgi:ferredoxin-NADP reductase
MHDYLISAIERPTPTTVLLTLKEVPGGRPFSFAPGQYAAISFSRHGRPAPARCFSITTSPTDSDVVQFCMRVKGRYTRALTGLSVGDRVGVQGPYGSFIFDPARHQRLIMIAGGIGIAPFMSMIRYAARLEVPSQIDLVYSCQNQAEVAFGDELMRVTDAYPNVSLHLALGDGDQGRFAGRSVATGRISSGLLDQATAGDYTSPTFMICGPPPFMKAVSGLLLARGVREDRIVTEAFSQGSRRSFVLRRGWPFNVYPMSFAAVALGSLIIMAMDLMKTLPPFTITFAGSGSSQTWQADQLNRAVNSLPPTATGTPEPSPVPIVAPAAANTAANSPVVATPAPTVRPAPVTVVTPAPPVSKVS